MTVKRNNYRQLEKLLIILRAARESYQRDKLPQIEKAKRVDFAMTQVALWTRAALENRARVSRLLSYHEQVIDDVLLGWKDERGCE